MKSTSILGISAAFLAGAAVALLASYPLPAHSIYLCFWAVFLGMAACVLTALAVVLHATHKQRVSVERVVDLTVDRMLQQRGLEVVSKR